MNIREFYERVTEGMALKELWGQFKTEAESSYKLYSEEVDWESLEKISRWRRFFKISWILFKAMLFHLTPARRMLLLVSLVLFVGGVGQVPNNRPTLAFWGGIGLILLLALELADRVIMKRDLQIAREIQQWLVPETPPTLEHLDIAFSTRPANTVGGDFYDVILQEGDDEENRILLVMADVAGKSVPAALLMATFQASLRALLATGPSLQELAVRLNRSVCERSLGGRRFTTGFLAEISLETGLLHYINAGHNYPLLKRQDGTLKKLSGGGLPFGIQTSSEYEIEAVQLESKDFLLIFTDGVVEAVNSSGEEFEDNRLVSLVERAPHGTAQETLNVFRRAVDEFVGGARQHDDMTWMVVQVK
jgi:serine phosphatase RsbU (regulator of sigma subunit)